MTFKITGLVLVLFVTGNMMLNAQIGRGLAYPAGYGFLNLPGLTDKQKAELTALAEKHQAQMDVVVKEMWEANDLITRNEASIKLQNQRLSHWNDVLKLLTEEQKNVVLLNNNLYGYGRGLGPCGAGYGPGRGFAVGQGLGYGPGRGFAVGQGLGYGPGRGRGWAVNRGAGYGLRRAW